MKGRAVGQPLMVGLFQHLITSVATLVVGWFMFAGTVESNITERLRLAFERIDALEQSVLILRGKLAESLARNIVLQADIRNQFDHVGLLEAYLDALPEPAWIKEAVVMPGGEIKFVMLIVNRRFEENYAVSRALYKGLDDYDVWKKEVADSFYGGDMETYKQRRTTRFIESIPNDVKGNPRHTRMVWKFIVPLPEGRIGVGGMIIEGQSPVDVRGSLLGPVAELNQRTKKDEPLEEVTLPARHVGRKFNYGLTPESK